MHEVSLAQLAERIKQLRIARELTLGQLARDSGLDKGLISRLESGQVRTPTFATLQRLANALDVETNDLLEASGQLDERLPSLPVYLRAKYGDLPPEGIAELNRYVTKLQAKYGITADGPAPGEDEEPLSPPPKRRGRTT
ncbi:MAG: hypothetical protein JWL72_1183 [Ilumatobacteraceae bacterium]|nr:hypothetical protein [Ilumatobacteraceae bacterium]